MSRAACTHITAAALLRTQYVCARDCQRRPGRGEVLVFRRSHSLSAYTNSFSDSVERAPARSFEESP